MADRDLTTRTGVGAALNQSQHDQNHNCFNGSVEEVTAATHAFTYVDHGKTIQYNRATAIAVTVPTAASVKAAMDTGVDNFIIRFKNINTGVVTLTSTDNIDGQLTLNLNQNEVVTLQTNAANDSWNVIDGINSITFSGTNFTTTDSAQLGETTNIPATATQVIVSYSGLSLADFSNVRCDLGIAGYTYTSHYCMAYSTIESVSTGHCLLTDGSVPAAALIHGTVTFTKINGLNTWTVSGTSAVEGDAPVYISGGFTTASAVDRIKITSAGQNFDAGVASVYWL